MPATYICRIILDHHHHHQMKGINYFVSKLTNDDQKKSFIHGDVD